MSGGAERRLMGVKQEGLTGAAHIDQVLLLSGNGQKGAVVQALEGVALSLRAVHRMGWIDLWSPEMHGPETCHSNVSQAGQPRPRRAGSAPAGPPRPIGCWPGCVPHG